MTPREPIIDCHVHLNNYHEEIRLSLDEALEKLRAAMAESDVIYSLVLTSYIVSEHRPSTAQIVRAIEGAADLGVVAGISYLHYQQRDLRELADFLGAGLVKGLKLYPGYEPFYPHDSRLRVVYELAEEFDVPVMIHCGDTYSRTGRLKYAHPLEVDEVAVDYPGVKLVICHLGNPWLVDCMEVVYKNANVYTDFSGLVLGEFTEAFEEYMEEQIADVLLYAGQPGRLLYGSDWPICSMRSYVAFMRQLRLSAADRHKVLYENTRRLFRLPLPAGGEGRVRIREARRFDDPALRRGYRLLKRTFPPAELPRQREWTESLREIEAGVLTDTNWHLFVAERGAEVLGAASGTYVGSLNMGFVGYVVVRPEHRAAGLGARLRRRLVRAFRGDAAAVRGDPLEAVVGEVHADNPWLRRVVAREGALALDVPYFQPSLDRHHAIPLVLYWQPLGRRRRSLPVGLVRRLLYAMWRRAYRVPRPLTHPTFRAMLRSLEGRTRVGPRAIPGLAGERGGAAQRARSSPPARPRRR
jgi:hypothetical protein